MPLTISLDCPLCEGVGTLPAGVDNTGGEVPESTCPQCRGEGSRQDVTLSPGYFYAVDVFECIKPSEASALSDAQKSYLVLMISAGYVDLSESSQSRSALLSFFPAGTETRAALVSLTQ